MSRKINIKSSILNEHFQCGICQGFIIDATTLTECLHSFCKSCIVHFINNIDHSCPTCNSSLKDLKNCIKSDTALQRLIYRMVPCLLDNEIDRREKFYENSESLLNKKTVLNIKLVHKNPKKIKIEDKENINSKSDDLTDKYIQCMAQTPIHVLSKLLRNKYNIPFNYKVKLTHFGFKLNEDETLLQVFTCFLNNKKDLFEIDYEFNKIKQKLSNTCIESKKTLPNKKIKLVKKNDYYLKLKEKRIKKQVNFSITKLDEKTIETSQNSAENKIDVDSDQPLDLTINK